MLGGLIAGALKGAAEGYTTYAKGELENQQKLDYQKQIMQMQEEANLRADEIKRDRDVRDIGRKATAEADAALSTAGTRAKADVVASSAKIDAANEAGLPQKEAAYKGTVLEANAGNIKRESQIKAEGEAAGQVAKTGTKGYLESVAQETSAKESSGSKAQAAAVNFELGIKKDLAKLRTQLSASKDPAQREELQQQIQDLQLGMSTKSYSDLVTAGDAYRKMADNLRREIGKGSYSGEEEKAAARQALDYEQKADSILQNVLAKRLPSAAAKPKTDDNKPSGARPPLSSFNK